MTAAWKESVAAADARVKLTTKVITGVKRAGGDRVGEVRVRAQALDRHEYQKLLHSAAVNRGDTGLAGAVDYVRAGLESGEPYLSVLSVMTVHLEVRSASIATRFRTHNTTPSWLCPVLLQVSRPSS